MFGFGNFFKTSDRIILPRSRCSPPCALGVYVQAMTERRCREISEQAAERVRGAQQMEERVLHETDKEARVLREALGRLEAEVERLRNEAEREGSTAQQEIQRRRYYSNA